MGDEGSGWWAPGLRRLCSEDSDFSLKSEDAISSTNVAILPLLFKQAIITPNNHSGQTTGHALHSGQTTGHARDLSPSGPLRWPFRSLSRDVVLNQIHRLQHVTERTVRQFVNEICCYSFWSWMNHYLDALPCMNEDFYGTKRKRGDPTWVKLPRLKHKS